MQMIYCPNCGKLTGFKRSLGFGTFFMVVITGGFWLLAIPFYPMRCITCGLTRSSAVLHNFAAWYRSLSPHNKTFMNTAGGILLLILGVIWFNGERNPATRPNQSLMHSAVNYDDANTGSDESSDVAPVVYSVKKILITRNQISTGTKLTIHGIYGGHAWEPSTVPNYDPCLNLLAYGKAGFQHGEADPRTYCRFFINVLDEDPSWSGAGVECNMSLEELKAAIARFQNSDGDRVLARGTYASSLHFVSYSGGAIGLPVLDDCTLEFSPPLPAPTVSAPPQSLPETALSDRPAPNAQPSENIKPGASSAAATLTAEAASGNVYAEVARALDNWAKAYESNDPTLIANCYADQVDRYFLRQNVSNAFVHDYMEAWFKDHDSRVIMFKIKDSAIYNQTPTYVQLRLVKEVVTKDSKGAVERFTPSELSLKRVAGEWKITGERDFK